jgi:plastocyanin
MKTLLSLIFTVGALVVGSTSSFAQTTHQVNLSGISFSPANITIAEGDTVMWNWVSGFHNVSSDIGLFTSGNPVLAPYTWSLTFDAAFLASAPANGNLYDYHCDPHWGLGMVGSVTVTTNNPVLTISNFKAGQTTDMTVTAATPGAPIGFAYSLVGPGPTSLNAGPCGAVLASLTAPITLLPQVNANASGTAVLSIPIPAIAVGMYVWVQALDLGNCQLSNGASMRVEV